MTRCRWQDDRQPAIRLVLSIYCCLAAGTRALAAALHLTMCGQGAVALGRVENGGGADFDLFV